MLVIGLGHQAQHGKDTFADAVYAHYKDQLDTRLISFADALRRETEDLAVTLWNGLWHQSGILPNLDPVTLRPIPLNNGIPFNGHEAMRLVLNHFSKQDMFEETPLVNADYPYGKQRKFLQWYGTDYRRAQDDAYWIKRADERVEKYRAEGADAVLFRDMRFDNEYDYVGSKGGYRIKVVRLNFDNKVPQHASETALANHSFDLQLHVSDGMLDVLTYLAPKIFRQLYLRKNPALAAQPNKRWLV